MDGSMPDNGRLGPWTTWTKDIDTFDISTANWFTTADDLGIVWERRHQVVKEGQMIRIRVVGVEPFRTS